jgi:hypothetical protein
MSRWLRLPCLLAALGLATPAHAQVFKPRGKSSAKAAPAKKASIAATPKRAKKKRPARKTSDDDTVIVDDDDDDVKVSDE